MTIQTLKEQFGDFAKDIKLNLGSVLAEEGAPGLKQSQIGGIALASAYATRHAAVIDAVESDVRNWAGDAVIQAAKAAATIMAMNNVYYRFVHLAADADMKKMPAKLRMNIIGNPGIDKVDFELYALAVSAINGCGMCMEAHVHEVQKAGLGKDAIQSSIRIAAVINAAAQAAFISDMESAQRLAA
jgi:alkyl hydroperoxide reductase subunit D